MVVDRRGLGIGLVGFFRVVMGRRNGCFLGVSYGFFDWFLDIVY